MATDISFLGDFRCRLGESPLWDPARARLWWVDAVGQTICSAAADGSAPVSWTYDSMVGSIGLTQNGLIAAFADHFALIDAETGEAKRLLGVDAQDGAVRLNDGKVDRGGRSYVCGHTRMHDAAAGSLFQLSADGTLRELAGGMRISNAICFSPDGSRLYCADSLDGFIRCHAYDAATGTVGAQTGRIDLAGIGQAPDGATVDADGNLWIALVLDQALACVSPDGNLLRRIAMPMPFPSCPAFGGPDLDTLYVTSIGNSGHNLVTDHPDGGRIAVIRGLGVTGLPESRLRIPSDTGSNHGI
ncbi:SMP-30/gluconolactonase/LRE family protein [Blastomonas sp. AAP53]|uniref:SMP-30/gluconolactonase/LRE family protein n=1 Tax=Blastomonas sp. AAP53 TaxID=1248760 RepID=UPI0002EAE16D|nr:SMP-30/gluconolactonase/LRE family protein [Blastomonas sp. AAP53]